jgi:hypothetical protein
MARRKIKAGTTSLTLPVFVQDTSSTTGGGLAITHASSGLVFEYRRENQSTWTTVTPVAGTLGTFTSGGIVADGSVTGAIEIGIPNTAIAVGKTWAQVRLRGVTNMLPVLLEFELDAFDYQTATQPVDVQRWLDKAVQADPSDYPLTTIADGSFTSSKFAPNAIDSTALALTAINEIADGILTRNVSNVEATTGEHTLATAILALLEWSISGGTLTIKRTNGSTTHFTKTLTTDAAAIPIIGVQ